MSKSKKSSDDKYNKDVSSGGENKNKFELPIFYQQIVPLSSESHADIRLDRNPDFSFAAQTNALPLTCAEFQTAMGHYPIGFAGTGDKLHAVAIVGLGSNENLFVDHQKRWQADCYLPAYVRRYPFLSAKSDVADELALCFDPSAGVLSTEQGERLFDEGLNKTPQLDHIVNFVQSYEQELIVTKQFVQRLTELDLLMDAGANITFKSGAKHQLNGLRIVDRKKLLELTPDLCRELVHNGYLERIYQHLGSLGTFQNLIELHAGRHPEVVEPAAETLDTAAEE
ncbi:MAG: SapC family protein [Oceanococcus sp.]